MGLRDELGDVVNEAFDKLRLDNLDLRPRGLTALAALAGLLTLDCVVTAECDLVKLGAPEGVLYGLMLLSRDRFAVVASLTSHGVANAADDLV